MSNNLRITEQLSNLTISEKEQKISSQDRKISNLAQPQFENFINFTDPKTLKQYLGKQFQEERYLSKAVMIAKRIYESQIRSIGNTTQYGLEFPMNPEVLAFALEKAKNEIVLEIAGASGENSILLAFGDTKRVYMNDIEPLEITTFKGLKNSLPSKVSDKLELIEGNCFDLLEKKPEISGKVGLILCQNLIHFFTDKQQFDFFQLLKKILKPGGRAIFTANSIYPFSQHKNIFEENANSTCFKITQCLLTDYYQGTLPCATLYNECEGASEESFSSFTDYKTLYLYTKNLSTGLKWQVDNKEYNKLDPSIRPKIKKAILSSQKEIKSIQQGSVRILINNFRIYNKNTLTDLFKKNGFEVESIFTVGKDGHLVEERDAYKKGQQLGIIVTYS